MKEALLSQEKLKSLLHYDPETGVFTWLVRASSSAKVGSVAGCLETYGYVVIRIDRKNYKAHRLAWLYLHGNLPPKQLDHINRDRSDNRICNLRLATSAENNQNRSLSTKNTSGHIGVCWFKRTKKWKANIKLNNKEIHLGYFTDLSEAIEARKAAEVKFHTFQHNQGNQP